jgi:hypothetical protein
VQFAAVSAGGGPFRFVPIGRVSSGTDPAYSPFFLGAERGGEMNIFKKFSLGGIIWVLILLAGLVAGCASFKNRILNCRQVVGDSILRYDYLDKSLAEREKLKDSGMTFANGVPNGPSKIFDRLKDLNDRYEKAEAKGCSTSRNKTLKIPNSDLQTTFQKEWEYQQYIEKARLTALEKFHQRQDKANQKATREREEWKNKIISTATENGYSKVLFDVGLTQTIWSLVDGQLQMNELEKVVIELDDFRDENFTALQVIGKNTAIYTTDLSDHVVMLKNYGELVLEGASLKALVNHYVVIKGVTTYETLLGTRQAFVIETAW